MEVRSLTSLRDDVRSGAGVVFRSAVSSRFVHWRRCHLQHLPLAATGLPGVGLQLSDVLAEQVGGYGLVGGRRPPGQHAAGRRERLVGRPGQVAPLAPPGGHKHKLCEGRRLGLEVL